MSQYGGEESDGNIISKCTNVCGVDISNRSCAKTHLVKVYPANNRENFVKLYAIIDDQSNCSLGHSEFFDRMNISTEASFQYTLTSCAGQVVKSGRRATGFIIESVDGESKMAPPPVTECNDIPEVREEIPTQEIVEHYQHLNRVSLPPLDSEAQILLLIGRDLVGSSSALSAWDSPILQIK